MFHLLAAPCIAIGFVAVYDSHNLRTDAQGNPAPIPNFYSLHSWMGLTTMGLFALQVHKRAHAQQLKLQTKARATADSLNTS